MIADDYDASLLVADGFDEAIIGMAEIMIDHEHKSVVIYDREKCIKVLMKGDGMVRDEAEEFFSFNVAGAYVGAGTPIFANVIPAPRTRKKSAGK